MDLCGLPLDLILEISDHLRARSIASLSLTCKGLYTNAALKQVWKRGFSRTEDDSDHLPLRELATVRSEIKNLETLLLLELLQKDLPHLSLCDLCQKLHPQREVPITMCRESCESWTPCSKYPLAGRWLHYDDWDIHLSSEHMQKFVHNHFMGSTLPKMSFFSDWEFHSYSASITWMRKIKVEPLMAGDCLILHVCQRLMISQDYMEHLGLQTIGTLASGLTRVCQCEHTNTTDVLYTLFTKVMCNPRRDGKDSAYPCTNCSTRFVLKVWPHTLNDLCYDVAEKSLEWVLDTWTVLGSDIHGPSFRTYDEAWLTATSRSGTLYNRQRNNLNLAGVLSAPDDPRKRMLLFASFYAATHPSYLDVLIEKSASKQRNNLDLLSYGVSKCAVVPEEMVVPALERVESLIYQKAVSSTEPLSTYKKIIHGLAWILPFIRLLLRYSSSTARHPCVDGR